MELERNISTTSLVALCIRDFHTLLDSIPDEQNEIRLKVQDEMGKLRVWVGNFGAHRKQTDRLSLDHRLREAPDLHQEVQNHIRDITEAIQGAISLFSGSEDPPGFDDACAGSEMDESDTDDSDSDGFWEQVKAENDEHPKLDEYMLDIQYTIASLYKFSLTLQNPAHRDRTAQASRIELGHFEFYDIQHVSDKYNIPRDSTLAQRLGKANTKRRQLLAYHKDHTEKISRYVDLVVQKAIEVPLAPIRDPGTQSISTKWTQDTTISTIYRQDNDDRSDSGQTKFSATTSTAGDQAHVSMPPPPPADVVNKIQNHPFFCPYCHQTIQLENMDEDWNYHVYSDLRPYICTFGDCVKANQLYDSYTEWSEHERQFHRREWVCNVCSCTFKSEAFFRNHLGDVHAGVLPEDQQQAMVKLSERSISSAQQCPLCTKPPISNQSRFQQHLARHLQQLSLFVLPRPESEENKYAARDGESNESQQVGMVDDESRTSLKSISTNQRSLVMEGGQTSSEGSESDDADQGRLQEAEAMYERALEGYEKAWGREHTSTLATANNLGILYADQGRLQEAEAMYERALEGYEKAWGREHTSTLDTVNNLGVLYKNQGRLQEAEAMYERALEGREKAWGREHTSTLDTVNNLGVLYKNQGRLQEAEAMYERALGGYEKAWGREHTSTLDTVNNLGLLYADQGRLQEAEAMYERALEGYEKAWGREHTSTLAAINNLGILYKNQGRLQEAEAMYERALEGYEKAWGREHTSTLTTVNNLGNLYVDQGRLQEAEAMYERALEGKEKAWGREHTSTLDTVNNLGILYKNQGRLQEAEAMYERALGGYEKAWGREHTSTLTTVNNLGLLYQFEVPEAENQLATQEQVDEEL
ncbi:unnamed protein product [Penicillium glandicola]